MKKRKWDANVALLLIFGMTLVIAAWTIWILGFFHKNTERNEKYVYILWNKLSSLTNIQALWLCQTSSYAKIDYNPIRDTYTLTCEKEIWKDISKFPQIIKISKCDPTSNICEYKFKK